MDDVPCNRDEYPTHGKCPVCSRTFCILKSGKLRAHKSDSFKCAGSGMEPLLSGNNLDFSADCTTKGMYNNVSGFGMGTLPPRQHLDTSTDSSYVIDLWIRAADLMSSLIQDALCYRSIESWAALICFPKLCLTSTQDCKSKRRHCTKKNIARLMSWMEVRDICSCMESLGGCKEKGVRPSNHLDDAIANALCEIIGILLDRRTRSQATYPLRTVGLGLWYCLTHCPVVFVASIDNVAKSLGLDPLDFPSFSSTLQSLVISYPTVFDADIPSPSVPSQARLSSAIDKERLSKLIEVSSTFDAARLLFIGCPHASAWLHTIPKKNKFIERVTCGISSFNSLVSLPENEDYFGQMTSQDPKVRWTLGQGLEIISPSFDWSKSERVNNISLGNQGDRLINEHREIEALSTEEAMADIVAPMANSDETNYINDDLDAVYSGAHSLSLTRMMSQTKNYADYLIIGGGASSVSAINVNVANEYGECTVFREISSHQEISFHTVDEDAFTSESPSSSAITLLKNRKATRIDIKQSVTTLDDGWKVTFDEALSATETADSVPEYLSYIIRSDRLFDRVIRLQSTDDIKEAKTLIDKNEEVADMIFLADMDIVDATIEHDGLIKAGDDFAYSTGPELGIFDNMWCAGNACNLYDTVRVAKTNMSCDKVANYRQQIPWLDIGKDMSIESVGRVHSSLDVDSVLFHFQDCLKFEINRYERSPENGYQAILFYYVNDKVAGIVLWGIVGTIRIARQIISEQPHKCEIQN
ncbi:hypothetical protein GJ496_002657 [Pomphorhynchus laevis]|nr:hypothetical protein GJ496_002657 [Pomphorhynchus laevis]